MIGLAQACCAASAVLGMIAYLCATGTTARVLGGAVVTLGYSGAFAQLGPSWAKQSDYAHSLGMIASASVTLIAVGACLLTLAPSERRTRSGAAEARDPYDDWLEQAA